MVRRTAECFELPERPIVGRGGSLAEPKNLQRRVVLRDQREGHDSRHLCAYLDNEGGLHIDGQDLGPSTGLVSEDGEYEWFQRIPARKVPHLVAILGGDPGDDVLDILER